MTRLTLPPLPLGPQSDYDRRLQQYLQTALGISLVRTVDDLARVTDLITVALGSTGTAESATVSVPVFVPFGTAAAPGIAFVGTQTGVFASASFLGFSVGGTERVRIDSSGNVGIGTSAPGGRLEIDGANALILGNARTLNWRTSGGAIMPVMRLFTDNNVYFDNDIGIISVRTGGAERFRVGLDGSVSAPSIGTTASAANAFLDSAASPANRLLRSTSSIRYKRDVRDLPSDRAASVMALRPVVYKSNAEADDPGLDWFGLIAEEVAEVEPRLCHYADIDGERVPDGVQYDRLAVLMLAEMKSLAARVADLESRLQG